MFILYALFQNYYINIQLFISNNYRK